MAPKSAVKRKAAAASQIAALARKKQRTSSESLDSLRADIEAVPTSSASLPLAPGNAGVNDGARPSSSVSGPTSGTEGQGESVTSGEPSPSVLTSYLFVLFYFLIVGSLITEFGMRI